MSIRNSFLALLAAQPAHGYGLKSGFEESTGGGWPLNAGQVYSTLARLERDRLVQADDEAPERRSWTVTEKGRRALAEWFETPVESRPARDELVIKVLVAVATRQTNLRHVLQTQRTATMRRLQEYTRHKMEADPDEQLAWLLLLDALILRADAEIRWLDRCEARLRQLDERGES
jgi:DNA-binding PadR family transcriptional regulator